MRRCASARGFSILLRQAFPAPRLRHLAMGEEGRVRSSEDEICALYLRNLLEGRQGNPEAASRLSSVSPAGSRCHGTVMGHDHQILGQAVLVLDAAGEKRLGAKPEAVENL